LKSETATIRALVEHGATLTPLAPDPLPLVISSDVRIGKNYLIYYVAGADYTGGVHNLKFDTVRVPHPLGVKFLRNGKMIAYLCAVAESGEESIKAWRQWQSWLAQHREVHTEAVNAEFDAFENDVRENESRSFGVLKDAH